MDPKILVDTGPLVALLNRRDQNHAWCARQLQALTDPLVTCDAVLSEAFFLLKRSTESGVKQLSEMIRRGLLCSQFDFGRNQGRILDLMKKYHDLPTSFADVCLVVMAESLPGTKVWTLDRDFRVYRMANRRVVPLICPNRE